MTGLNQPLPNSEASERNLLGAILIEPELLESVREGLTPERFYNRQYQAIYAAMLDLRSEGEPITPVAIHSKAPTITVSLLTDLTFGASGAGWEKDVRRIVSTARRRWMLKFVDRWESRILDGTETEDELLAYAASQIDSARTKLPHQAKVRSLSEMIDDQAGRYRSWHRGISNAMPTGFSLIDDRLLGGGFVASGLYVLAARPSMGKTALCLDIAANIAQEGKTVYFVSREMPAESLLDRLHSANAGIARWKLRPGIYANEYNKLLETLPRVCGLPIILDNLSRTTADMRAQFREMERKHQRPDLMIVDYLQLIEGTGRSRNDEVGSISRALKGIAMEFQIPVLALSQLSRDCDKHKREPELSDLRDSGEIEQDADAVFFLFGERPEESASIFSRWLKCSKQRDGELFRAEMTFNGELVTFRSFDQLATAGIYDHTGATT